MGVGNYQKPDADCHALREYLLDHIPTVNGKQAIVTVRRLKKTISMHPAGTIKILAGWPEAIWFLKYYPKDAVYAVILNNFVISAMGHLMKKGYVEG